MESPPRQLGRYRIEQILGQGQAGTVYLATDPAIDRAVAIKVLRARPEFGADEADDCRARFEREVKVAARLSHPHIVGVLDVGWEDDAMFVVMEHVDGIDLQTELEKNGPLPLARALEVCDALAGALDAAHALGIVHRDVKPGNVLVGRDGSVKLTDFGIAHVTDSRMTRTGMTYGTPAFMSPEQATAATIGPSSDQFSLASLLYYTLTGEVPFAGTSSATVMYRLVNEEPVPLESVNPGVPPEVGGALLRALSKNPDDRFTSCAALAEALRGGRQGARDRRIAEQQAATTMRVPSLQTAREAARSQLFSGPLPRLAAVLVVLLLAMAGWSYLGSVSDGSAQGGPDAGAASPEGAGVPAASREGSERESTRPRAGDSAQPLEVAGSLPRNLSERADNASQVLRDVLGMADGIPTELLDGAHCVAVIPGVIKVGFGFGGRHGKGLVSCRTRGGWSPPSFVSLTGGSFGLQIGAQSTDFVLVFNRPDAAQRLTSNSLTFGGNASASAGPVGRTAEAGTDVRLKQEIYAYSRSKGLFAGVSLEGATLRIDEDANRDAYGRGATAADLLLARDRPVTPELDRFLHSLETAGD